MTRPDLTARRAAVLNRVRGRLVVSCQARVGEPLHGPEHMRAMALSALAGGAAGLRLEGADDIAAVRASTDVPIIGLWKIGSDGVYITPTLDAARAVADAGADVVAVDGTGRDRPDGSTLAGITREMQDRGVLVMADVASLDQGIAAARAGVDLVGSTLSGYLDPAGPPEEPDLDLVRSLVENLQVPVVAEGRITTPDHAAAARALGADVVVVGGAITRPGSITARFAAALGPAHPTIAPFDPRQRRADTPEDSR